MERIKVFLFTNAIDVENVVNKWLSENREIEITGRLQSQSEPRLTISIFYKERGRGQ